jgi:spermidine synthase
MAALVYQVVWMRLLGLTLGSTHAAVATVVTAFFAGLTIGNLLAPRLLERGQRPLAVFAGLEATIAVGGLALLPILLHLPAWLTPPGPDAPLAALGLAIAVLAIPTAAMGATFPVLSSAVANDPSSRTALLGRLYALNTAGAVSGALAAGFLLIPLGGLDGAVYVAVALNGFTALLAWHLSSTSSRRPGSDAAAEVFSPDVSAANAGAPTGIPGHAASAEQSELPSPRVTGLLVLALTGFASLATEVGWTRCLSIMTGATVQGFALILGILLTGMACGSRLAERMSRNTPVGTGTLTAGLVLLSAALFLARAGLSQLPEIMLALDAADLSQGASRALHATVVAAMLALPTLLLGGLFPLALGAASRGGSNGVARRVGRAYALNTLAGIGGSLMAGFLWIPTRGTDSLLSDCAAIVAWGALACWLIDAFRRRHRVRIPELGLATLAVALALVGPSLPGPAPERLIAAARYAFDQPPDPEHPERFLYIKEAPTGIVAMVTRDQGTATLKNNGLNESKIDLSDPHAGLASETLLSMLPWLLHERPRSAFVVGFGGGTTTRVLTYTDIESVRVVELEPAIIEAVRSIPNRPVTELDDPRVELTLSDARHVLLVEDTTYDLIMSQPSHPWLAGAGQLFTAEFFALVRKRLAPGGIFGQWVNLFRMDATTLRGILRAYYEAFPHGFAFANLDAGDLLLYGSDRPLRLDAPWIAERTELREVKSVLKRQHLRNGLDIMLKFYISRREALALAGDAALNTDLSILSEVRLGGLLGEVSADEDPYALLEQGHHFDLLPFLDPASAARTLSDAGTLLALRHNPDGARLILEQLRPLDEQLADALQTLIASN